MNISSLGLIEVAVLGAVGFIVLRVTGMGLSLLTHDVEGEARLRRAMTVVEGIAAVMLLFFAATHIFLGDGSVAPITIAIGIVVVAAAWFLFRDVSAGFVVRAGDTLRIGDKFETDKVKGTVRNLGYRVLVLESEAGEEVFVPYSAVQSATVTRVPRSFGAFGHAFTLTLPKGVSAADGARTIQRAALLSHWHSPVKDVQLDPTSDGRVIVRVFALHPLYGAEIETRVKHAVAQLAEA